MLAKNLIWILQSNAIGPADLSALTETIRRLGMRAEHVRVIPFSHEAADVLPTVQEACIVYGSIGLLKLARKVGWRPGGWDGPDFNASSVIEKFGTYALNRDAVLTTWSDIVSTVEAKGWSKIFVRPDAETKEFAGYVHDGQSLKQFVQRLETSGYLDHNDHPVLAGPALSIGKEWRAFVVDRKIVGTSRYANGGKVSQQQGAPEPIVHFIEEMIEIFAPAPCFVIDVAEAVSAAATELRVAEFNSLNSSGFYACDKEAILTAVSDYVLHSSG